VPVKGVPVRSRRLVKVLAAVIAFQVFVIGLLVVRIVAFELVVVPGDSMAPTIESGDRLVVDKIHYRRTPIARGDIVLFDAPTDLIDVPDQLVKRVVGLPGEAIVIEDGQVLIHGEPVDEPFARGETATPACTSDAPCRVPEDAVWVLGDNRLDSTDSRVFGPVPLDHIVGYVQWRVWPPSRIGRA
jgi:signal peptidase I